jgi:hypothetical protein
VQRGNEVIAYFAIKREEIDANGEMKEVLLFSQPVQGEIL